MKRYKCRTNVHSNIKCGSIYDSTMRIRDNAETTIQDLAGWFPKSWEIIEDFILPKMWAIKVESHTKDIIYKWKIENTGCSNNNKVDTFTFSDGMYGSSLARGYTEITFEQFKEHVLKEKPMKKIIGYKFKEGMYDKYNEALNAILRRYGNSTSRKTTYLIDGWKESIKELEEAGVLDLWFNPVYEEEFKVGDWIVLTPEYGGYSHKIGDVLKIAWMGGNKIQSEEMVKISPGRSAWIYPDCVRKATPEEIESAQIVLPKINGYDGKMIQNNQFVKYGCATMDIDALEGVYGNRELSCNRSLRSVELDSGVRITMDQIKQILDYADNL